MHHKHLKRLVFFADPDEESSSNGTTTKATNATTSAAAKNATGTSTTNDNSVATPTNSSSTNNTSQDTDPLVIGNSTLLSPLTSNSTNTTNATTPTNGTSTSNQTISTPLPTSNTTVSTNTPTSTPLPTTTTNTTSTETTPSQTTPTVTSTPVTNGTTGTTGTTATLGSSGSHSSAATDVNVGEIIGIVAGGLAGLLIVGFIISSIFRMLQKKKRDLRWIDFDHNNDHKDDEPISSADAVLSRHRTTAGLGGARGTASVAYESDKGDESGAGLAGIGRLTGDTPMQAYEMSQVHTGAGNSSMLGSVPGEFGSNYGASQAGQHYPYANLDGGYDAEHAQWYHNILQPHQTLGPISHYEDSSLGNIGQVLYAPHPGPSQQASPQRSDHGAGVHKPLMTAAPESAYAEYWGTTGLPEPYPPQAVSPALSASRSIGGTTLVRAQSHTTGETQSFSQPSRNQSYRTGASHATSNTYVHSPISEEAEDLQRKDIGGGGAAAEGAAVDASTAGGHARNESAPKLALPDNFGNLRVVNAEPESDRE